MRRLALIMLLGCTAAAAATYRWVDANGVVHYSDTPGPGAQKIDLPSAQTYRAPPVPPVQVDSAANKPTTVYQSCAIASPGSEATLFDVQAITVTVALQPAKRDSDVISLSYDGTAVAPSSPGGQEFRISPVDRGAHTVTATVRDADNKTVCTTAPLTFYVRQPSVLAPQSPLHKK